LTGYEVVTSATESIPAGALRSFQMSCPAGKRPISGGWGLAQGNMIPIASQPFGAGWLFTFANTGGTANSSTGYLICATAQ
jgi:hypothetical protein